MTNTLVWESAGTDELGDQNATSVLAPHAHWSLGPDGEGWAVELIVRDDALDELPGEGVSLGRFADEGAAKAAAQVWELDSAGSAC